MPHISRRTAILALAAIAGAGVATPVGAPLRRLADATAATTAAPDAAIDVDYRIADVTRPPVGDEESAADRTTTPEPIPDAAPDGIPPQTTETDATATATASAAGGASPAHEGTARAITTVDREADGRVRLLTRASTPPIPVTGISPGEGGSLALAVRVGAEPVFLVVRTAAESLENGRTESETAAGDATADRGELADFLAMRVVRQVIPAVDAPADAREEPADAVVLFEGTVAGLLAATADSGLYVPGDRPDGTVSAGATCELLVEWTFLTTPAEFAARELTVPGDVNVTQTDRLDIEISVDARTVA